LKLVAEGPVYIAGAEAICALGGSLDECLLRWRAGETGITSEEGVTAGRIGDRSLLRGRRYGAASNLAVVVARRALQAARWPESHLDDVWLFGASSRGNAGELLHANAWRRGSKRFRASNTMHSEIAAAVSIELGLRGPWQMISNGCSAGLDALGMAWMALRCGLAKRALVVAVDLPLAPDLLRDFRDTRLLSRSGINDPLSPKTDGFSPGEAAAAVALDGEAGHCEVVNYAANSDAYDSLVVPADGAQLAALIKGMNSDLICPHATGTANHAVGEIAALRAAFGSDMPPLLLLKPFTGHTLGASGLLDVALLAGAMGQGTVPGNRDGLYAPDGIRLPLKPSQPRTILKIASGMGGHNAAMLLRRVSS
jgi:3-oxoacyl-[acyl-carrier-protein] synthase II